LSVKQSHTIHCLGWWTWS